MGGLSFSQLISQDGSLDLITHYCYILRTEYKKKKQNTENKGLVWHKLKILKRNEYKTLNEPNKILILIFK
jgi:hypothetical protein